MLFWGKKEQKTSRIKLAILNVLFKLVLEKDVMLTDQFLPPCKDMDVTIQNVQSTLTISVKSEWKPQASSGLA